MGLFGLRVKFELVQSPSYLEKMSRSGEDWMDRIYQRIDSPSPKPSQKTSPLKKDASLVEEYLQLKFQLKRLKQDLLHQTSLAEKLKIDMDAEKNFFQSVLDEKTLENQKLTTDRQFLYNREKEANRKFDELQKQVLSLKVIKLI